MSAFKHFKVDPTTNGDLFELIETIKKLNRVQLEQVLDEVLRHENIAIKPTQDSKIAARNFRVGFTTGIVFTLALQENLADALTHNEPLVRQCGLVIQKKR